MKTNETKMKKMMVKGVCSVALAGTVFGTVAPMVENNVAMAIETAPEDGIVLWDNHGEPSVKDWAENTVEHCPAEYS
ncbi:hypothetical protein SAMN05421767_1487 [Granulicatella balaenopterae]|uniref:Uncharacterized protein n=1 Tax=Granulicatella balaenopterae TaxID=137733 RepID=A0A1H9NYZ5_9LACT|nr:hypothetical protein [Granulicatella balaenopterae]SER41037.1 hypothetical protein SAMN05421767_1487 [Granulicatella balaenopterae]